MDPIDQLRGDNILGATAIADRALDVLGEIAARHVGDTADLIAALEEAAKCLAAAQPMMATIGNRGRRVVEAARSAGGDPRQAAADEIARIRREAKEGLQRIAGYGAALIPEGAAVATISASSAVRAILLAAAGWIDRVLLIESRPMREGVSIARDLAIAGLRCELSVDAAAGEIVQRAGIALVGADTVTATRLYNKTGTYTLAILCREHGVPLYAAFPEDRVVDTEFDSDPQEMRPPEEVAPELSNIPGITVVNRYFESTPRHLFAGFITENGVFSP